MAKVPKDPKKYEKLVKALLEAQLSDELEEFQIFGSKHYHGKSGHDHQIDVSAEFRVVGVKILVLVECKRYTHKVGIDDVMEFATRLDDIGAQKGILVSIVGFQEGAVKIAKSYGIALVLVCDLGWTPCCESPVAAMRRHEEFATNAERFLSWFLGANVDPEAFQNAVERVSRCDVTSSLGVTPQPFCSLSHEGWGLKYAGTFAPDHGFIVQGEGTQIVLGSRGLFQLCALDQNAKE